jgi:hypothetical protein
MFFSTPLRAEAQYAGRKSIGSDSRRAARAIGSTREQHGDPVRAVPLRGSRIHGDQGALGLLVGRLRRAPAVLPRVRGARVRARRSREVTCLSFIVAPPSSSGSSA